eukprot:CAMPEP_0119092970 /NCGR_PEP_ID=MMETSP1178-20130426/161560_1 /TAXON_ID=33656 /ORGANISM="unid sp, Strain CCMP2000" /LENGTH=51 /DNA_ID=CAMNT_0007076591 /DNA_START=17 /DNA_END=168 /DNA_ORIENTATION=+
MSHAATACCSIASLAAPLWALRARSIASYSPCSMAHLSASSAAALASAVVS